MVVHSLGGSLEVLNLGEDRCVDAATLHLVGATCSNMKKLSFHFVNISTQELVSALGDRNFPLLEAIEIGYSGTAAPAPINDDVILALCAGHPHLEVIVARTGCSATLSSVAVALFHCPRFCELISFDFQFKTIGLANMNIYVSDELPYHKLTTRGPSVATAAKLRAAFGSRACVPLRKHRIRALQSYADDEDLVEIIDTFGEDIHTLHVHLGADVSHHTLARLFEECTKLSSVYFEHCVVFTDELVMLLADQCPHVFCLQLAGATSITDVSVCYLLQRIGRTMAVLLVEQCSLLTNPTLISIAEYCTQLLSLDITGTGITDDAVITHVVKPNRLPRLVELIAHSDLLESLINFVGNAENGANKRWRRVLQM